MNEERLSYFREAYLRIPRSNRAVIPAEFFGVEVGATKKLFETVASDLDPVEFGISWWKDYRIGTKRKIFISDYLIQCLEAISVNLSEAKMCLLEFEGYRERVAKKMEGAIEFNNFQGPDIDLNRNENFDEHMEEKFQNMWLSNFFCSLGTTLDCVYAVFVGVTGMPESIFSASFSKALDSRRRDKLDPVHRNYLATMDELIKQMGPPGWLEWALQFRNMVVHRGRISTVNVLQFILTEGEKGPLFKASGLPYGKTKTSVRLPSEPDLSEAEILSSGLRGLQLPEDAAQTMNGIHKSTEAFISALCTELTEIWLRRRADPKSFPQPRAQWGDNSRATKLTFNGYAPDPRVFPTRQMTISPMLATRMNAAALMDGKRELWKDFD